MAVSWPCVFCLLLFAFCLVNFSAVILAGGKSARMGRDKAFVEIGGQTLLARQLALARAAGAREVFISGRADVDYSAFDYRVLLDDFPAAGPLAGIECALAASTLPLLLVLQRIRQHGCHRHGNGSQYLSPRRQCLLALKQQ